MELVSRGAERALRRSLLDDHLALEGLLRRLEAEIGASAHDTALDTWSELERSLLGHLGAEELYLFPAVLADRPDERHTLSRQHGELRALAADLGAALEHGRATADAVRILASRLRDHARAESETLYAFAEASEDDGPQALEARARRLR